MAAANSTFPPGYLDEYIGFKLVWLSSAFIAINVFFVGLRYFARYVSRTSIGADDYITIFSLVCAIALSAIGICEYSWGSLLVKSTSLIENPPSSNFSLCKIRGDGISLCGHSKPPSYEGRTSKEAEFRFCEYLHPLGHVSQTRNALLFSENIC